MRPFRVGRWGSIILPLGPNAFPRQYCPLSRRIADYNSNSCCTRLQFSTSSSLLSESEAIAPAVKRKRGRPPKSSSTSSSSSPLTSLPSSLAGTATSLGHDHGYPASVIEPNLSSQISKDASSHVLPTQTEPPSSESLVSDDGSIASLPSTVPLESLPSPPVYAASQSAKLSALHARLSLSSKFPLETLARTLVDKTADSDIRFNNNSLSILGEDFLRLYMTEHMICRFPRLPRVVLNATIQAYIGPAALASLASEWGIEAAAEPGGEVDPGLLQFKRTDVADPTSTLKRNPSSQYGSSWGPSASRSQKEVATLEKASANFIRALTGAVYLHCGSHATHSFFASHILSRKLDIASLFTFKQPERDLSRLCAREGFDSPVARLLSETGRLSRSPVFIVGVFSGTDKLGEGSGSSLMEARARASIRALKGWYLYSPVPGNTNPRDIHVPSMMEDDRGKGKTWKPVMIDMGEIVV